MMDYTDILYETKGRLAIVTLNRPEKMNALSHRLRSELFDALKVAEADQAVRVIIIRGSGRAFSAGYDLGGANSTDEPSQYMDTRSGLPSVGPNHPGQGQWAQHLLSGYWQIWELAKPVIAQVHGYCLAGGTELATFCDLMFVAEDAVLGYPPVRAMTSVDMVYHPWHMSMRKARELLYTGDSISGEEAVRVGWANQSYPADRLAMETERFAERIANIESDMLLMSKRGCNRAYEVMGIRTALAVGADIQALSTFRPSGKDFGNMLREKGLKAALDWRDGPFRDYRTAKATATSGDLPPPPMKLRPAGA
jgi:enoyl-CoA hydratase